MKKKILITYAMYGNGHKAIAEYIGGYFKEQDPELEIKLIDLLEYSTPILGSISQKISNFLILKIPFAWNVMYDLFDSKFNSKIVNKAVMKIFKNKRMQQVIKDFNPDLTISTHYFGSSLIEYYNKKKIINSKLVTVVTDYEAHSIWVRGYKSEQAIIVGDKDEVKSLIKKGVSKDIIKPIGIPIRPQVKPSFNIEETRKKYGFTGEKPICIFFGGGGNGGTTSLPYFRKIVKYNLDIDFIYIAGHNQNAKIKVDNWIKEYNVKNIKTYGFVNNVPELLEICDFVVSKPGGAQTTESLYFNKPILMINCSGGQERANYKYFEKNGYGKYFNSVTGFFTYIKRISDNPQILNKMHIKMSQNHNDKSMEKLYKIAKKIINEKK